MYEVFRDKWLTNPAGETSMTFLLSFFNLSISEL